MNRALRSNLRARKGGIRGRVAGPTALLALSACGCRSITERELALAFSAQALPGAGAGIALSQLMLERGERRIDFELGLERQKLADEGRAGDDWTRIWAGRSCTSAPTGAGLAGRAGVTWLRSEGEPSVLPDPGDYGGIYVGAGWAFALAPALTTGPDLNFLWVDSEGDRAGSGGVFELAWRWTWQL